MLFAHVPPEIEVAGPLALMMPWNIAFRKLDGDLITKLQDRAWEPLLQNLLRYHIYNGHLPADTLQATQNLTMANGEDIVVTVRSGGGASQRRIIEVNGVRVIAVYDATNGFAYMVQDI